MPSADAVTVRQHHSLVALPDAGFRPRRFDPRAGFFDFSYEDYSAPLGQPITQRFIARHRLQKKDPAAPVSEPVAPIVYYVDRGAPEPIRTALLEGVRWWNQAFEAAGYRNAFRAELMPEGADPMDVRYNVVQWVHRSTRGWSYGGGVTDPRTGEIIQGHVTLGSLRIRQDYLIAEGLLAPYTSGRRAGVARGARDGPGPDPAARRPRGRARHRLRPPVLRQQPRLHLGDGLPAPAGRADGGGDDRPLAGVPGRHRRVGQGGRDRGATRTSRPASTSGRALDAILHRAWERDLKYLSNQDADYNPRVDQWANGADVTAELDRMMKVRRAALAQFGERVVRQGEPVALAEEALVPLYLHHRYQVEAVASAIGGLSYHYALRGDGRTPWNAVSAAQQLAALDALIRTLRPSELTIPRHIVNLLAPRPDGFERHRELFPRNTGLPFDVLAPAMVAADLAVALVLQPDRAARLVNQQALDPALPGLGEVIDRLVKGVFAAAPADGYEAEVARVVQRVVAERLMTLAGRAPSPPVRAIATRALEGIARRSANLPDVHRRLLAADITRFLERPFEPARPIALPSPPPGAPIGEPDRWWLDASPAAGSWWWAWMWDEPVTCP